ncbi:aldo/keto reductase [Algoriphagus hitonicola]|uniref:Predicted oxidoreductase n=1 Tax=Algoriphagus hitonicola TaxID=435880 RepID=A0A1I2TV47_9BACT|nr:aldo/keto reductase [Algoriphagus hitonicola]SFG68089.1 Predicted oxidoreductase [Algoriphagus hitonicola]
MNTRTLKKSGFEVSEISLGCMSLPSEKIKAEKIIKTALEGGIKLFDTADLYQKGQNESLLGEILKSSRKELILATKVGNQWRSDGSGWDWNPRKEYILRAVEESLTRLKTDYIDLYQLHGGTMDDPWEEKLEAFELLKSQGKIRAYGISSIRPNVIRKVMTSYPPATVMMQYSPLDRRPEEMVFPALEQSDTRVLVRGAFAKGFLLDKPASAYLGYNPNQVAKFQQAIQQTGLRPEAVLIAFGLVQPAVASLVIGASSPEQVSKIIRGWKESKGIDENLIKNLRRKLPTNHYQSHR